MERFYLIDFENVHNNGLKSINSLTKSDQVHIFYTENAKKVLGAKKANIIPHEVPAGPQSLDKHLISYLGYLIGKSVGKTCSYIIVSNDQGYDNIIAFWQKEGIKKIYRKEIPGNNVVSQKKTTATATQTIDSSINDIISKLSWPNIKELDEYMYHKLINSGYDAGRARTICDCVVNNDKSKDDPREKYLEEACRDVKTILEKFLTISGKNRRK